MHSWSLAITGLNNLERLTSMRGSHEAKETVFKTETLHSL